MTLSRPLQVLAQSSSLVARNAAFRLAALACVLVWGFDRAVYFFTESSWFGSLGMGALWRARCAVQLQLLGGALFVAWLVARGPLAAMVPQTSAKASSPLRPALRRLEPWRTRVPRFLPRLTAAVAVVLAYNFAHDWPRWLALRGPLKWGVLEPHFGADASLWTTVLPPLRTALGLFSWYCLFVFGISALGGLLLALPNLLRRVPRPSVRWARSLWLQMAGLLVLRALMLGLDALNLASGSGLTFVGWWFMRPLLLGAAGVALLLAAGALLCALRRAPGARHLPRRRSVVLGLLVVLAPALAQVVGWWGFALPAGPFGKESRAAQQVAWGIAAASPAPSVLAPAANERRTAGVAPSGTLPAATLPAASARAANNAATSGQSTTHQAWPVWDEAHLIDAARQGGPFHWVSAGVVNWESAGLTWGAQGWSGTVAGYPPGAQQLFSYLADEDAAIRMLRVDPVTMRDGLPREMSATPLRLSFFGLEGRPLVTSLDEPYGVDITSWAAKLAWAWRLRDPILLFQEAPAHRLLVWRGAQERALHLLPWLVAADAGHPVLAQGRWYWELDLLGTTATYPGSDLVPGGAFGTANAAWDAVKVLIDAHTGAVEFFEVPRHGTGPPVPYLGAAGPLASGALKSFAFLPRDLRGHLRYPDALLAVQGEAEAGALSSGEVRGGEMLQASQSPFDGTLVPPTQALAEGGGAVNRMVLLSSNRLLEVEASQGANYGEISARTFNLAASTVLDRLDHAFSAAGRAPDVILEPGPPFFWQGPHRPSTWWVAQPLYSWTEQSLQSPFISGNGAHLDRVVVVNSAHAGVGEGPDLDSALQSWHDKQAGAAVASVLGPRPLRSRHPGGPAGLPLPLGPPPAPAPQKLPSQWLTKPPLAQQALAAHDRAVRELAAGQPQAAQRDFQKERNLLQALAR